MRHTHRYNRQRLQRDVSRRKIAGVCAGIAHYLDVQPVFCRIATVISFLFVPTITLTAYGLLWLVLDREPHWR